MTTNQKDIIDALACSPLSQSDIASEAGVSQPTVSRFMRGEPLRSRTLLKLEGVARAHGLIGGPAPMPSPRQVDPQTVTVTPETTPDPRADCDVCRDDPMPCEACQAIIESAPDTTAPTVVATRSKDETKDRRRAKYQPASKDDAIQTIQGISDLARKAIAAGEMEGTFSIRPQMNSLRLWDEGFSFAGACQLGFFNRLPGEFQTVLVESMRTAGMDENLIMDISKPRLLNTSETIARIMAMPDVFLWVHGPAGSSKTYTVLETIERQKRGHIRWQGSPDATPEDLLGGLTATAGTTSFGMGPLPLCVLNGWTLLVDEVSACRPDVTFEFHAVLEGKPLVLKADGGRVIHPHPEFRIIATDNGIGDGAAVAGGYIGTAAMNEAFRDRWVWLAMPYMSKAKERRILRGTI